MQAVVKCLSMIRWGPELIEVRASGSDIRSSKEKKNSLSIHSQIAEHISNAMGKVNSLKCNIRKAKKINNKVSQTSQLSNK